MVWKSPVIPWDQCSDRRKALLWNAWSTGDLSYKLHPSQLEVYHAIKASWGTVDSSMQRVFCLDVSRQWGKDFLSAVMAVETVYRYLARGEQARIPYAAPTQDGVKKLLVPTLERVFDDCPPELRPTEISDGSFVRSAHTLTLPGGRHSIQMVGCDLHPDYLRGPSSVAAFFSECGFMKISHHLGIVLPQLLWHPEAFVICNSSPPDTPAHEWDTEILPVAQASGMYATRNIYDNPALTPEQIEGAFNAPGFGGKKGVKSRRELLCEHVADAERLIVPEFQEVKGESDGHGSYTGGIVTSEYERPKFFAPYVALDPGWSHLCAGLFAFWDFKNARLVVEDDFAEARANSRTVAKIIDDKERALWGDSLGWWDGGKMVTGPKRRVSDTDLRMIADLESEHKLVFTPTAKDNLDAQINALRLRVQAGQIIIHPRCKNLIAHIDHGIWNKNRTEFAVSGKDGHFDCVAALVYLDRNIDRGHNPTPPITLGIDMRSDRVVDPITWMQRPRDPLAQVFMPTAAKKLQGQHKSRPQRFPGAH